MSAATAPAVERSAVLLTSRPQRQAALRGEWPGAPPNLLLVGWEGLIHPIGSSSRLYITPNCNCHGARGTRRLVPEPGAKSPPKQKKLGWGTPKCLTA